MLNFSKKQSEIYLTTNEKMQKMANFDIMKFGTTTITAAAKALTIDLVVGSLPWIALFNLMLKKENIF